MKRKTRILVLCKTYPSPSTKYAETSCVAGMDENGALIRLFPVPFRMVQQDQQFAKWQWIEALIEKSPVDHRPESHKIYVDTIVTQEIVPTSRQWCGRRQWLEKVPFDFYYHYECESEGITTQHKHKIVDWEACALYRNVKRSHGAQAWETAFRDKIERQLPQNDLMLLMGTVHRFPDQWLIVSLIYPPRRHPETDRQQSLF
ncbi:hypothetical protein [Pseudomonas putida]